jgi:hypothetical protein
MDLLGYGAMLKQVGFDPSHPQAEAAIDRLKTFQTVIASFATKHFPAMPINDGVAFFHDLSPRTNLVTYEFLEQAINVHKAVNELEEQKGQPGARMVIAVGARMRISGVVRGDLGHKKSIFKRVNDGVINADQAVHEAFRSGPIAGFVPQLQANFAFTKAYCADDSGGSAGLGGNRCYVDLCLFNDPHPSWITFSRKQSWSMDGMETTFGELKDFKRQIGRHNEVDGILNALEIAERLGILHALD